MPPSSKIQQCTFEVAAPDLDPDEVTALFHVEPDRAARRGEVTTGRRTPRHQGVWEVSSISRVPSIKSSPSAHLACIAAFAVEHTREIAELKKRIGVTVGIRVLWEFEDLTVILGLDRQMLSNLAEVVEDRVLNHLTNWRAGSALGRRGPCRAGAPPDKIVLREKAERILVPEGFVPPIAAQLDRSEDCSYLAGRKHPRSLPCPSRSTTPLYRR